MTEGLVTNLPLADSMVLPRIATPPSAATACSGRAPSLAFAEEQIKRLRHSLPRAEARAGTLSGGNLQKALLARELAFDPTVLIVAQPTRGLDIGATGSSTRSSWRCARTAAASWSSARISRNC